jgi:hypothetical protein
LPTKSQVIEKLCWNFTRGIIATLDCWFTAWYTSAYLFFSFILLESLHIEFCPGASQTAPLQKNRNGVHMIKYIIYMCECIIIKPIIFIINKMNGRVQENKQQWTAKASIHLWMQIMLKNNHFNHYYFSMHFWICITNH